MKEIYEYEFSVEHKGKKKTVQQSGHGLMDAKMRLRNKLPECKNIKMTKRYSYPHLEGGKKIG